MVSRQGIDVHELSVCQALLDQVTAIAREKSAQAVECISIDWGPLSGVEPELLRDAFVIMRLRSVAASAELLIEHIGVRVACIECGAESDVRPNRLICGQCSGFRTRVVAGDELRLRQVRMRVSTSPMAACV